MASVVIAGIKNDIQCITQTTPCSSFIFITYKLYQGFSLYTSFSTTAPSYTFNNVPVGFDYYVQIEIYTAGPTLCDSATSNTITLTSYCIPSNATDMSFDKLKEFYDLNSFDILLSGPNNPSTAGSIFGNSDLPNTGTPSKTRPNAVSELRSRCGGIIPWTQTDTDEVGANLVSTNSFTLSAEVRDNSSNVLWGSVSRTSSSCNQTVLYNFFSVGDTDSKFTATVTRTGSIVGTMNLIVYRLPTYVVVNNTSYSVNTSNSYTQTVTPTLDLNYSHRFIAIFQESTCDAIV